MALLTPRAAADRLGVAYSTLKRWIRAGHVRTSRTSGGHHRIAGPEIERLLASSGTPARAPAEIDRRPAGPIVALSARNRLRGFIEEVRTDGLLGQVRLRIGDQTLTAVVTRDAIDDLRLRRGDEAVAIVKSTEVMIAREVAGSSPAARPGSLQPSRRGVAPPAAAKRPRRG